MNEIKEHVQRRGDKKGGRKIDEGQGDSNQMHFLDYEPVKEKIQ